MPIGLVLPCHIKEVGSKALKNIIKELKQVKYIKQIVVGIDGANLREFKKAKKTFSALPQNTSLLWNDGPKIQRLYKKLEDADLSPELLEKDAICGHVLVMCLQVTASKWSLCTIAILLLIIGNCLPVYVIPLRIQV
jgi:hypothetical protein